jgi:hypothetical protein
VTRHRGHGIEVWEDEGGSSAPSLRMRAVACPGLPKPRRRMNRNRLVTRLVMGNPPPCAVRARKKRRLLMVFVMYAIVLLAVFAAVAVAAVRDTGIAKRAAEAQGRK